MASVTVCAKNRQNVLGPSWAPRVGSRSIRWEGHGVGQSRGEGQGCNNYLGEPTEKCGTVETVQE